MASKLSAQTTYAVPPLRRIAAAASAGFLWRVIGAALMLAFQVAVARRVGATIAGRFYLVFAVTSVVAVLGRFGTDMLVVRLVATGDLGGARAVPRLYRDAVVVAGGMLGVAAVTLALMAGPLGLVAFNDASLVGPLRLGALAVVPFGLVAVQGEALKGLGLAGAGAFVQSVIAPACSLALLVVAGTGHSLHSIVLVHIAGVTASSLGAHLVWRRANAGERPPPVSWVDIRKLARSCTPFVWTSAYMLVLAWGGVIALGLAGRPTDVAAFFAADRWTGVCSMILVATNAAVAPHFASLWARGDRFAVRTLLRSTTLASAVLAAVVCSLLALASGRLLAIFDATLTDARPAYLVMLLGQFVVLAGGPVTVLLAMTGHEKRQQEAARVSAIAFAVALALLVPLFGVTGAAVALAGGLILNKALIVRTARQIVEA